MLNYRCVPALAALLVTWASLSVAADSQKDKPGDGAAVPEPSRWVHPDGIPRPEPALPPAPPPTRVRRVDVPVVQDVPLPVEGLRGRLALVVANELFASISNRLDRHARYLQMDGYDVVVYQFTGSATDLRAHLASLHNEPASLVGAKLIGNIPYVLFQSGSQSYICDLFFMDLDGVWADTNSNGRYNSWTGDKSLEIWVSRIRTDNLPSLGTEIEVLNNYFNKNHAYRSGALRPQARGLAYIYKDWSSTLGPHDRRHLEHVYGEEDTTFTGTTSASDYKNNRLPADQEFLITRTHGNSGGHHYGGWIYSADYRAILPPALFYQLGSCNVADFTAADYVAGTIAFNQYPAGLFVWGLSQTGMMWDEEPFYTRLSDGHSLGSAFQAWFEGVKNDSQGPGYFYGSLLLGDASLRTSPSFPPIHTLSGHVRAPGGAGIGGVMLVGLPGNPVTDGEGSYEVMVSYGWTGAVTPVRGGYDFSPTVLYYDGVTENANAEDYEGMAVPVTLAGTVRTADGSGIGGVRLDGLPCDPQTDHTGFYSATLPHGWSGTVTPVKDGNVFNPHDRAYAGLSVNLADEDYVFETIPGASPSYTVTGFVRAIGGTGVGGVLLDGLPGDPVITDGQGFYIASVPRECSGTVSPSREGYVFDPVRCSYAGITGNLVDQSYAATPAVVWISGYVHNGHGTGISEVTLTGFPVAPITGNDGYYQVAVPHGWSGTVIPQKTGFEFSPVFRAYDPIADDQLAQDYGAAWKRYTVSGRVRTPGGAGVAGVIMDGLPGNPVTDHEGRYGVEVPFGWTCTVQPLKDAFRFTPRMQRHAQVSRDLTDRDHTVYFASWGAGSSGQTQIPVGLSNVVRIASGGSHNLALRLDGRVVAWGSGEVDRRDFPDYGQSIVPTGLSNVVSLAAGFYHSLAVRADGTVIAWGAGGPGQSTWNDRGQCIVPVGLSHVVAVAGGSHHSLALKADGTVVAWGAGGPGQDGFPHYGQSTVPAAATNVIAITADGYHSLALRANGTVVAWGRNDSGQITVPEGLNNAVAIAAGHHHSVAVRADGTVVAWGAGGPGQSGGLHHGQSIVPPGLNPVRAVAAGSSHTLALHTDGTLTAWGSDSFGMHMVPSGLNNAVLLDGGNAFNLVAIGVVESPAPAWGAPIPETPPPRIQTSIGQTVFLRTHAVGHLPMTFTWLRNGEPVSGADDAVLTLSGMQADDVGFYQCVIANASGVVTTETVAVYMYTTRGVPTDWYQTHGIGPGAGQTWNDLDELDSDGDGMLNWMEHRAGTNPMDAACCLAVYPFLGDAAVEGAFRFGWPSVAGRRYRVERTPHLVDPLWVPVAVQIEADPPENVFIEDPGEEPGPWYYRLRLE